ncbi:MAG: tRNA threonylcarbamoyladenosine dehydratase [Candidatus Cloacimonetes bacterium]|nr:tRNA threonylcarbamoyladenosine dehydratase [Candidatus Cloacimonadota bacterium]MDD3524964.1 tRNA threonylcarbamoyladenosine dehydratase [Candidatus Cloacimonadota bacterium]
MKDLSRTELLLGADALARLRRTTVCVVGLGGVGSYATEALARAGIGTFILIDFDTVGASNLNRQLLATLNCIGKPKTELMKARILAINEEANVICHQVFLDAENRAELTAGADYVIDAIDSLGPKIGLLEDLAKGGRRFISVMGAGNRLDPSKIHVDKISKSYNCPLARRVRKFLRRRGVKLDFPCVYSTELAMDTVDDVVSDNELIIERGRQRQTIGSISYMPAIMGMMAASWVIRSAGLDSIMDKVPDIACR